MPDELLMRQVPQDLTAEQSLLGAMLVDPNCIPEVIEQVRADDFYAEENKRIFETIYSMFNGAQRIDPVTVLDMLTRMGYYDEAGGRHMDNRVQEVAEISRSLKIMAKELNVPVVCLSQLSRASEQRSDKRPMLSDLRESGAIEQDADIVMFIYRDDYYDDESENKNIAEIIIAKNRHGATGTIELQWVGQYTTFSNPDRIHEE